MFKMLVVESEYRDYTDITGLTDLEKLGVESLKYCDNGISAMEAILAGKPDVVFTDLVLPGLDGFELIRKCRENGIGCSFVITSKFRRFDYVQSLIRYGIEDYLVKPVEKADLERIITNLTQRKRAQDARDMNEQLWRTRRSLRNSFMESFTAVDADDDYNMDELNEKYHFSLKPGMFRAEIVSIHNLPRSEYEVFLHGLVQSARARFDPLCFEMVPYTRRDERLTLLFNYAPGSEMEQHFGDIQEILKEHLQKRGCSGVTYSIGLGIPENDIRRIRQALDTAEWSVQCRLLHGANQLFDYSVMKFDNITSADVLTPTVLNEMSSAAECLNEEQLKAAIKSALSVVTVRTNPEVIMSTHRAAARAVWHMCIDSGYEAVGEKEYMDILERLTSEISITAITDKLTAWAGEQFEKCRFERQNSKPVRQAQLYIQAHYMEPLTLEHIAEQVHLNASYFSIIFKKQTGQNFSDFLTGCRIEAAKQLLRETDNSIASICEEVGYLDRKYFSRIFEKNVGLKPSAYRALHD